MLDTHVRLCWLHDASRLRQTTRELLADPRNVLLWSAASTRELAIKLQLGKLRLDEPVHSFAVSAMAEQSLTALPVHHASSSSCSGTP